MKWSTDSFDIAFLKRILCQNGSEDQAKIADEVSRVVRPTGQIVVVEPWLQQYGNLNNLRTQAGLAPLPEPRSGGNLVSDELFESRGWRRATDLAIARDYTVWTRYLAPLILGRFPSYDQLELRQCYPLLSPASDKFAFYRLKVYDTNA
jgi:hypothetical protein